MGLHPRSTLRLAAAVLAAASGAAVAQTPSACIPDSPALVGPAAVQAGGSYALSWTNVLGAKAVPSNTSDAYVLQRGLDPAFASGMDATTTQRSALTLTAPASGATTLYHRVWVRSSCAGAPPIYSNVVAVPVKAACDAPPSVGTLSASPENPPAFSTWVVTWDTLGSGPGPGGLDVSLKFRIRRTSAFEPDGRDWVVDGGAASFTGGPGDYVFQVRAEAPCGAVGPWSTPKTVTVGSVSKPSLVLVSEPAPLARVVPTSDMAPGTSFVVRNAGTDPVTAKVTCDDAGFAVSPTQFTLAPGATQEIGVVSQYRAALARPVMAHVGVSSGGVTLSVPVVLVLAAAPAAAPVAWTAPDADIDADGAAVMRTLVNTGGTPAAFVASINVPWISVEPVDGLAWDRPLAGFEVRPVRLVVDRTKRRATSGTEVGAIAITTVGQTAPKTLVVTDDGPRVPEAPTATPSSPGAAPRTRILYAAFPNAIDAKQVGRFAAELWLTNTDAVNAAPVSLLFTPVGPAGAAAGVREFDLTLAAGETRRYRNVVGTLLGSQGAFAVEVRSPAATISATAVVLNTPLPSASTSARRALATAPTGSYGLEMRPTSPGEGAKQSDPIHVVSGLAKDANRRSNLLLLETSGYDTIVQVTLTDRNGAPVLKGGEPVRILQTVPANGTIQLNGDDVFFDGPVPGSYAWATLEWVSSAADGTGAQKGSVVGMATVIDNRSQDSSLHVGVSTNALNPQYVPTGSASASRTALASLPYAGGPAPLAFPTVHSAGAPLATGDRPFWRTRITMTNTNETTQRNLRLKFIDALGNVTTSLTQPLPPRAVLSYEDTLEEVFDFPPGQNTYGQIVIENTKNNDGTWATGWADVDVQTESYTIDPTGGFGEYKTGMEGYAYFHGYSSFQSNLGTLSFSGAENSSRYRTNLILNEVGGAWCDVVIAAYLPGSFVPMASVTKRIAPFGYFSDELFTNILGLNLTEVTDVRVVVRQIAGDGVFLSFASKIDRASGDPANIFLRPAAAGTGR